METSDNTVARQAAVNAEALRRCARIASGPASTEDIDEVLAGINARADAAARASQAAEDAVLNWGGGVERVATVGPYDAPMSSSMSSVAGVGAVGRPSTPAPRDLGRSLTSSPFGGEGLTSGVAEIVRRTGGR